MNKRFVSVIGFAIAISAVASFILYRFITARIAANQSVATSSIVVAGRPLPAGTLVKDSDLKMAPWPGAIPAGASAKTQDFAGRGVVAAILENEPVVDARLAPKGGGAGLAATIPSGMRAVAVSVNEVVGVAGFVTPGMHVDVLVSGNPPGNTAPTGPQTRTVLQNIEVLSAGQNFQKDAEGKPIPVQVVNLLVTPEQAETLSLASHETRIQLVLRNPLDHDVAKTPGTAVSNLFGGDFRPATMKPVANVQPRRAPRPAAAQPPHPAASVAEKVVVPIIVEVIHGTQKTESKFQPQPEAK